MFPIINPVSLIRYLIVWRVNSSLVYQPSCLPVELSRVLGALIANRLPTRAAREWRKFLAEREEAQENPPGQAAAVGRHPLVASRPAQETVPEVGWPLEAVLLAYPGRRTYGQGEVLLWELKLLGNSADHGIFLELILPAMEEAATTSDSQWRETHGLWGHFDLQAIYAARGPRWEPVVEEGNLDLKYRPSPTQWREGLTFGQDERRHLHCLTWITPFDLRKAAQALSHPRRSPQNIPAAAVPTLPDLLDALMARMTIFLPGKRPTPQEAWALVDPDEQEALRLALEVPQTPAPQPPDLHPVPKGWPGRWIGAQTFRWIPPRVLPYLELASILHVGQQTHFGCGTFRCTIN